MEAVEEHAVRSWITARTHQPQYIIARSVLTSSIGFLVTVCVVVSIMASKKNKYELQHDGLDWLRLIVIALQWIFILTGWAIVCWRWLTAVVYYPRRMVSQQLAKPLYDAKIMPSTLLPKLVGNMYTASLYAAFASIVHNKHTTLVGQRVLMFSYGSGLASTMFSFKIRERELPFTVSNITEVMDIQSKLDSRQEFLPEDFVENLKRMETLYGAKDFVSTSQQSFLRPGAFYLTKVDSMYRRFYSRKTSSSGDNFEK